MSVLGGLPPGEALMTADAITGVVLAGGQGRRMSSDGQGVDKGLQMLHGKPLVQHAIERLKPQVSTLLINANRQLDRYRTFGWPVVPDSSSNYAGPLAGLESAMAACATAWVVTVPCDSPLFPTDLVARLLLGAQQARSRLAVAHTQGQAQPVFLLAHCALHTDLSAFLARGERKIDAWYTPLGAAIVTFPDEAAFININTREELNALAKVSGKRASPLPGP